MWLKNIPSEEVHVNTRLVELHCAEECILNLSAITCGEEGMAINSNSKQGE
jgi:hypothetical protein